MHLLLNKRNELKSFNQISTLQPEPVNINIFYDQLNDFISQRRKWSDVWLCDRSVEYFKWRFVDHPNYKYEAINNDDFIAFIRRGYRSNLYEIKLSDLLFDSNDSDIKNSIKKIIQIIKKKYSPDVISICLTENHPYFKYFKGERFITAPFRARYLSKYLPLCPEISRSKKNSIFKHRC